MKIPFFILSLLLGFSVENIAQKNIKTTELVGFELDTKVFSVDSRLIFEEKTPNFFTNVSLKNAGMIFSFPTPKANLSLGFGNFEKDNFLLHKVTPSFSLWEPFSFFSKTSPKFLTLPSSEQSPQPLGIGLEIDGKQVTLGFSALYNEQFPQENKHFLELCFFSAAFKKNFSKNLWNYDFLLQSTVGYSLFSKNQEKNKWFSEKIHIPKTIVPMALVNLYFIGKKNALFYKFGTEFRLAKNPLGKIDYLLFQENEIGIKKYKINFGIFKASPNFSLGNNNFVKEDFGGKLGFIFPLGKSLGGFSLLIKGAEVQNKKLFTEHTFLWDLGGCWEVKLKKTGINLKIKGEDIFTIQDNKKKTFENVMNPYGKILIDTKIDLSKVSLETAFKLHAFSTKRFWENPENQYNFKIGYKDSFGAERKVSIDSCLNMKLTENKFYSEKMIFELAFPFVKIKFDLELINQFLKKSEEKSGINFGISGTINL